jgi:ribosomal protein S18 acetylase RimI-like enzyme
VEEAIRQISDQDALALASIHAASWQSSYRGIFQDTFLDSHLLENRLALWNSRLNPIAKGHFGYLATAAETPIGFGFAFGGHDPYWGTQIDNLHVVPDLKGRGIGKRLLLYLGEHAQAAYPNAGLYLWVYERNTNARRFYERLGGEPVERAIIEPPGGGEVAEWRYAWRETTSLLETLRAERPRR